MATCRIWSPTYFMMTSSNGNIFRVTGHLCGEFTCPSEFPTQRPVTRSFDVFFDLPLNKRLRKQSWAWWFETLSHPLWRHCKVDIGHYLNNGDWSSISPQRNGKHLANDISTSFLPLHFHIYIWKFTEVYSKVQLTGSLHRNRPQEITWSNDELGIRHLYQWRSRLELRKNKLYARH